jgi:hypothetical protein
MDRWASAQFAACGLYTIPDWGNYPAAHLPRHSASNAKVKLIRGTRQTVKGVGYFINAGQQELPPTGQSTI